MERELSIWHVLDEKESPVTPHTASSPKLMQSPSVDAKMHKQLLHHWTFDGA
jgi:hypothetical protein